MMRQKDDSQSVERNGLSISPAWSLIIPGIYHLSHGRYRAAFLWVIAVLILSPTVILALIALLLCYRSALRLSETLQQPGS